MVWLICFIIVMVVVIVVPCARMSGYWSKIEEQKEFETFCKEFNYTICKEDGRIIGIVKNDEVESDGNSR